ncbi:uncharacterized protein LOC136089681 [Hydra vulgaris]|uniref:Uncharacterized protein LOC136089681 n=1 Tax=Hydra vulgaris TaxID=6087 RepID=A0ABM4DBR0_HYDVU
MIKEVIGKKSLYRNLLPLNLKFNNKQIVNKSLVAETLNQFFVNIGPTLSSNIATTQSHFSSYLTSTNLNVMSNYKLTEKELLDAVSLLKPNKSLGFDDISSNVIIKSIKQITIPLLHIFNLSLKQGVFPDNLKIAKVIPVLKSGDPSDVTNYRPISILSCFSKILERVMYNRLYSFLNVNNILFHKQFGFKSSHSTDHAITHLVHDIFKGFDEDKYTLGVFIDLSKAFDTVNHQILLSKLKSYGIINTNLSWFDSYLTNRKQFISYDSGKTEYKSITCGVPQGSILGPLLFLVYINDLYKFSNILNLILFADDTNLFYSSNDISNVVIVIKNLTNPCINPLPRFENVDGLTLRYKHNGQPENKTSAPEKSIVAEAILNKKSEFLKSAEETQKNSEVLELNKEEGKSQNEEVIQIVCDLRETTKSKRKSQKELVEGETPSKQGKWEKQKRIKRIENEIQRERQNANPNLDSIKEKHDAFFLLQFPGAFIRTKQKLIDEGKKPSKFLYNLEKTQQRNKSITEICKNDDTLAQE